MDVGERLKSIRQSKNISIYKLSQDSAVSESHIRNLERGIKHATVETLEMLVKNLNITMSEFFNEDDTVSYPTPNEKALLENYRTLPGETASAVFEFCEKLKNQS
jgi:transcriptional regulator with XRE-family HTH domain